MDRIKIRETSSKQEGAMLGLLEAQSKLEIRESEIRKVCSDMDDVVTSLHTAKYNIKYLRERTDGRETEVKRLQNDPKRVSRSELDLQTNLNSCMSDLGVASSELLSCWLKRTSLEDEVQSVREGGQKIGGGKGRILNQDWRRHQRGLIVELQGFQRAKDDFGRRMENLGVRGARGYDWSRPNSASCGPDSIPSRGRSRRPDWRQKKRGGGPSLSRNSADQRRPSPMRPRGWQRNRC